jgi:transitional endoplasmic reticulum ATPase
VADEAIVSQQQRAQDQALNALAKLGGLAFQEDDLLFEGRKFIIPEMMGLSDALLFLERKIREESETTTFSRTFNYRPWDGAAATFNALKKAFGSVVLGKNTVQGFFGPVKVPPNLIDVPSGPNGQTIQVPWGGMQVPFLTDVILNVGQTRNEHGTVFQITGEGPKRFRHHVEGIFRLIQDELENNSLYRGKAFDGDEMPKFLDPYSVDKDQIVYAEETAVQIEANILAPIRYPEVLSEVGISGKKAALLYGPYGTGKTSTAMLVAQEAIENGWTFVYARPDHNLSEVFQTARLYEPAVVFFEDLDKTTENADRADVATLLDLLDGVASKDARILAILTTNHPEQIHKGMIRPGRLDAVIEIGSPDGPGVQRLIEAAIPENMLGNIEWDKVIEANLGDNPNPEPNKGQISTAYLPAFIREGADRAVRFALVRTEGNPANISITTEDLVHAANGLRPQWEMMQDAPEWMGRESLDGAIRNLLKLANEDLVQAVWGEDLEEQRRNHGYKEDDSPLN